MRLLNLSKWMLVVMSIPGVALAAKGEVAKNSLVFTQVETTTSYRAVFAQYLAVIPNEAEPSMSVDSAVSVSNVCAAPEPVSFFLDRGPTVPKAGAIGLVLYDQDGTILTWVTTSDPTIGVGLGPDGTLAPGQTWTVRLAEVLEAIGKEGDFRGYGWVLSGFDCLAGTYSNTIFGLGFTQSFELVPAMGQGGWFGGVPVREVP